MTPPGAQPHAYRLAAPEAPGRMRLHPDTSAYVAALAGAANMASLELDVATATHGLRFSLAAMPAEHPADTTRGHAAREYPPAAIFAELLSTDAERAYTLRGLATYAAQWYLNGALFALEAMLTGKPLTPHDLEGLLASRNAHRPMREVEATMPHYGEHNRPSIPRDVAVMATGHTDLDVAVATEWAALWRTYSAVYELERIAGALGQALPLNPPPNADGVDVTRMYTAMIRFAHTVADAADYGHGAPTPA